MKRKNEVTGVWEIQYENDGVTPLPLYTGKNPSYLDAKGVPHLINHSNYQKRLPTQAELKEWFANPANAIGTLGGWNDTVWIDFDVKHFGSEGDSIEAKKDDLAKQLEKWFNAYPQLMCTFIERTHSGRVNSLSRSKLECPVFSFRD